METPGGQNPTFWPKMTTNIGIIQITSLFGPSDNVIQSQIYIQDKAWWYLFIINCITGGGESHTWRPRGSKSIFRPKMTTNVDIIQIMKPINEFRGRTMYPLSGFVLDTIITHKKHFRSRQERSMNGNVRRRGGNKIWGLFYYHNKYTLLNFSVLRSPCVHVLF